jgi:hypothetical protein
VQATGLSRASTLTLRKVSPMDGFFDGADDLLDSIQTKKTTKAPTKRPLDSGEKSTKNDNEFINKNASGPAEKKMRVSVPKDVILVQPISKVEKNNSMDVETKQANENTLSHQFGDIADRKACQHEMLSHLNGLNLSKTLTLVSQSRRSQSRSILSSWILFKRYPLQS